MKKILAIMLALMLCLTAFVACGDNKDDGESAKEKKPAENEEAAENDGKPADVENNSDFTDDVADTDNAAEADEGNYIVSGDYIFDENGVVVGEVKDSSDYNVDEDISDDYVDFYSESDLVGSWTGESEGTTGTITFDAHGTVEISANGETAVAEYKVENDFIYVSADGSEWEEWAEIYLVDGTDFWFYTVEEELCMFEKVDAVDTDVIKAESYETFTKDMFIGEWKTSMMGIELIMEFTEDDVLNMIADGDTESGTYKIENNAIYFSDDGGETWDESALPVSSVTDDVFIVEESGIELVFERV